MHKLWYRREAYTWNEALPFGNGRLGVMAFSGALSERFMFNEETIWSGYPKDSSRKSAGEQIPKLKQLVREKRFIQAQKLITDSMIGLTAAGFLPFGTLTIDYTKNDRVLRSPNTDMPVTDYYRALDLKTAQVTSSFSLGGTCFSRRAFVSKPDNVFVAEIRADKERDLHFNAHFTCALDSAVKSGVDSVTVTGVCPAVMECIDKEKNQYKYVYDERKDTVPFCGMVKILSDGIVECSGGVLSVAYANYATILVSIETGFTAWNESPRNGNKDYKNLCKHNIENAANQTVETLFARHLADYQPLYRRFEVSFGEADTRPVNALLEEADKGKTPLALMALMLHYSRYLLIACSREGTQPANLQGLWNAKLVPPWRCDYTVNINTQMNYWGAERLALPECHMPLFAMIKELAESGKTTAKNNFDAKGWVQCHNTDLWRLTPPAGKGAMSAFWPMGGLWLCRHIWEHYDYTRDTAFLKEYFEVIEGCLDFLESWLYKNENGFLTTVASTSPENEFLWEGERVAVSGITAMDIGIILDFVTFTAKICDVLGNAEVKERCKYIQTHLTPLQITSDGRVMEWDEEYPEAEPGHRHISHLYCLHPAGLVAEHSPLFDACKKSLAVRLQNGGGHTGWSCAWIINQFARLNDGEKAMEYIKTMLQKSVYPNLFDAHPPFQIDGNFGLGAGICEMLLQCREETVTLLPAISMEMKTGSVRGMRIPGGFTVSFSWDEEFILEYEILKDGSTVSTGNHVPYPFIIKL